MSCVGETFSEPKCLGPVIELTDSNLEVSWPSDATIFLTARRHIATGMLWNLHVLAILEVVIALTVASRSCR